VVFGVTATGTAFYAASLQQVLRAAQFFLGFFTGPILAIFMLGMLTRRGTFSGWLVGLAAAISTSLWVQRQTTVHFVYYFPLSFLVAFGVGYAASLFLKNSGSRPEFCLRQGPPPMTVTDAEETNGP